jgi:hypothetical protein
MVSYEESIMIYAFVLFNLIDRLNTAFQYNNATTLTYLMENSGRGKAHTFINSTSNCRRDY